MRRVKSVIFRVVSDMFSGIFNGANKLLFPKVLQIGLALVLNYFIFPLLGGSRPKSGKLHF